jgi:hypothetical protein
MSCRRWFRQRHAGQELLNNFRSCRGNEAELTPKGPPAHVGGYSFPGTTPAAIKGARTALSACLFPNANSLRTRLSALLDNLRRTRQSREIAQPRVDAAASTGLEPVQMDNTSLITHFRSENCYRQCHASPANYREIRQSHYCRTTYEVVRRCCDIFWK